MLWVAATVAFAPGARAAEAPAIKTVTKKAAFDDVLFELNNAIIDRGLAIDHQGKIGEMLERTGSDVGSTKPIYKKAEFISFCSALLSRRMMEADPANIAYCPYVVFIYETVATPGEIIVGYRPPAPRGDEASRAALAEIDRLLGDIIANAVK
jgi:uncharacterized protein (DUF302 family)